MNKNLFQLGKVTLHSGHKSDWKIDCDALSKNDWACLAKIASEILPSFGLIEGIPEGGLLFADALIPYATRGPLLIVDDVCTTGNSLNTHKRDRKAIGVVVFSRGGAPNWVTSLFVLNTGSGK